MTRKSSLGGKMMTVSDDYYWFLEFICLHTCLPTHLGLGGNETVTLIRHHDGSDASVVECRALLILMPSSVCT